MNAKKIVLGLLLLSYGIGHAQNNNNNNNALPQPPEPLIMEEAEVSMETPTDMTATGTQPMAEEAMEADVTEGMEEPTMEMAESTEPEAQPADELSLMPTTESGEQKPVLTQEERDLLMQKINEILSRLMALENLILQQSEAEKISPVEMEAAEDDAEPMDTESAEQALEEEEDQPDAPDML